MPGLSGMTGLSGLSGLFGGGEIPLTIDGLQLWVKADEGVFQNSVKSVRATSDGDVIGVWEDQSGNGNDISQATTANKPILKLDILNSRPIIRFDGTDDRLINSTFSLSQPFTTFVVYKVITGAVIDSFDDVICAIFRNAGFAFFRINAGGVTRQSVSDLPRHLLHHHHLLLVPTLHYFEKHPHQP